MTFYFWSVFDENSNSPLVNVLPNLVFPKCLLNSVTKIFVITVNGLESATQPPLV